jgi:hypothetical protein
MTASFTYTKKSRSSFKALSFPRIARKHFAQLRRIDFRKGDVAAEVINDSSVVIAAAPEIVREPLGAEQCL